MLFFVELEAGRVAMRRDRIGARELVEEVAAGIPEPLDRSHVPLRVEVAPEARTLWCDGGLLRRVMTHLLANAFKFTVTGAVTVTIAPDDPPGAVVVAVRDTGVGIPSERLSAVFELFAQADASTTRRFSGLGIGLTIVQRSVRLLGGEVTVASEPGQGSEFRVRIPEVLVAGDDDLPRAGARVIH